MSINRNALVGIIVFIFLVISSSSLADFVAYNDCIRGTDDTTADNVTNWTIYNNFTSNTTGYLIDYSTGLPTSISVAFSWNASTGLNTSEVSGSEDGISQPRPGTPAYEVFGGIVDFSKRLVYYGNSGWWVEIEFSGLNPDNTYSFATTAIRAKDYTRYSDFTISNHDSAVNNSSEGIYLKNGDQSILIAAGNHRDTTGYIVRWDEIQVVDQGDGTGSFVVRAQAYGSNYKAYPFGGFMFAEISGNNRPKVNAGDDLVVEFPSEYIILNGSLSDDGNGEPNGFLQSTWSQVSGPVDVEFVTDRHQADVTVRFPEIGDYVLQLYATDGEYDVTDQVNIAIVDPSCPVGDISGDCVVAMSDMVQLAQSWLDNTGQAADLNGDSLVSMQEVSLLAQSWQQDWTGSLEVNISPAEAVDSGAMWRIDGSSWLYSGTVVSALPEGDHLIEYSIVAGWVSPLQETVDIIRQQSTQMNAQYEIPPQTLAINEFMAVNSNLLDLRPQPTVNIYTSVNGEPAYEDWIEIKNMTDEDISLDGWYLTDDPDNLAKWPFPTGYSIAGQGYFVVYASNKDADKYGYPFTDDNGKLHTNFDLNISGEYLALVRPGGVFVEQEFNDYPRQRGLVSYGSASNDIENIGYLTSPTFAGANSGIYDGLVADTKFSIDRGFYDLPFTVEISCDTVGAQIYYTTDNSEPTESNGNLYTAPITIDSTTCLRAAAFKSGHLQSNTDTQTYIFLDDVTTQATNPSNGTQTVPTGYPNYWISNLNGNTVTGDYQVDPDITEMTGIFGSEYADGFKDDLKAIPSISIVLPVSQLFGTTGIYVDQNQDGTERSGSVEFLDPTGVEKFHTNCGIRMQGGASGVLGGTTLNRWKCYKLSFRLMFRGIFGGQLDYELFGSDAAGKYNTIVLDSRPQNTWVHSDVTQRLRGEYVRDQVASDAQLAMGSYACHGRPVHLYLNGLYWGLYWMHERPDAAFAASYLGGDKEDYDVIKHAYNNAISGSFDDIVTMFNLPNGDGGDEVAAFESLSQKLDVDDFIDYMLLNYYIGNGDWDHKNWYASRNHYDPDGRWRWHTWDAEHVLDDGTMAAADVTYKNNSMAPTGLHQKWIKNDEYRMLFADRVYKHFFHDGALTPETFVQIFNDLTGSIDRAIVCESARWGDNRRTTPYTRNVEWLDECDRLRYSFIPTRRNVVLFQFMSSSKSPVWYPSIDAPEFYIDSIAQYGGDAPMYANLTMADAVGIFYYTTDGTDPRLPGGAVNSASANVYSSAVMLDKAVEIKARALYSGQWSPLAVALFNVGAVRDNLRITEIMYNPAEPNTEYIELQNVSTTDTINLNRLEFTNGIQFTFADKTLSPGQYTIVVQDEDAFENIYGTGLNIAGQYTGLLSNSGEKIELVDAAGNVIQNFEYKDSWYTLTDGIGFSLNIRDASGILDLWNDKESWRASLYAGGTPGSSSQQTLDVDSIVINELLAHSHASEPDWIELKNNTDQDINVGGWFISDQSGSDPNIMKFQIPDSTTIKANGFLVFVGDSSFNNSQADGCIVPFGLSEGGETVYLFSGESGYVTGYFQTRQKFDASETSVSFGRYEKAELTKGYDFVRQFVTTRGFGNAVPLVDPVVISEIYYNPDNGADYEFVELYNRSSKSVTLMTDVNNEISPGVFVNDSISWRLEGTGFEFPDNVTIEPYEFILVAKDPDKYDHLSCDVYGPYDGKLDNGGEEIAVQIPGDKEYGKDRYWIPVEIVDYDDSSPWPASADGDGDSIRRIDPAAYGSDYTNWFAASPTPGL